MLVASYDSHIGWIDVRGTGLWSQEDLDHYVASLPSMLASMRRSIGYARVLADLSDANVQTQSMIDQISGFTADLFNTEDRIAIIVPSTLMKMQMRRGVKTAQTEIFVSAIAAKSWLMT
jgi:hypothetical protein